MLTTRKSEQGFSLVEMAIVMVIVGLIVAAVTVGKSTMQSAETLKAYQKIVVPCVASGLEGVRNGAAPVSPKVPEVKLLGILVSCNVATVGQVVVTGSADLRALMVKNLDNGNDVKVTQDADAGTAKVAFYIPGGSSS